MSLKSNINKTYAYVKTYGLFKGMKIALERRKASRKNSKEMYEQLPKIEESVKDILLKYKDIPSPKFDSDQKNIFVFWWDRFDEAPEIVKACMKSVKKAFKSFKIIEIDKTNYQEYAHIDESLIKKFEEGKITIQTFSDILRFNLLKNNGGLWIDSTDLIVNLNEANVLDKLNNQAFVSIVDKDNQNFINYKDTNCSWSTFFLGGVKGSPLFQCLCDCYVSYINSLDEKPTYFLTDILLLLCKVYGVGQDVLNKCKPIESEVSFFYLSQNLFAPSKNKEEIIDKMTIQKLNWRLDLSKTHSKSLFKAIIS